MTRWAATSGNVVIDVHDYLIGVSSTDPNADGRQWNGIIYPTYQGGTLVGVAGATGYTSTLLTKAQHAAYVRPYKAVTQNAGIPLMIGEWGWAGAASETAWISDAESVWRDAGRPSGSSGTTT
jgi:hypothetical protein